jgi:hypothetical protein
MTSGRTTRIPLFGVVILWQAMKPRPKARKSSKNSVVLSLSLLLGGPTTSSLNIVSLFECFVLILIYHDTIVPVKYEHVVFCGLSELQLSLYRLFISSPEIKALLRGTDSQPLKAINILKKLCNHPQLLNLPNDLRGSDHLIPSGFTGAGAAGKGRGQEVHCEWSGKFLVLER